ncbi:MAG: cell division protein SepF [Methanocellales archaeon]|nr:cell division protein SepF [Methanocellales archaeon]MDD3291397.1 cell division protein SepF [Methanocellales archaeon]MDD5234713.1 cell division protein SepF [Methanocellales archaeon]MDD5484936.1 cell division protein SepF [Methanocellales archaeon]
MPSFIDKLIGAKKPEVTEYDELDIGQYEEILEDVPAEMYVRIAQMATPNELPELKKEVYDGNILIIDISHIKNDKATSERAVRDLKQVAADVHGDIAGIGENQIIVTPTGIRIDRTKIVGKY